MSYIGKEPADSFISFAKQDFSTSATTSYTLDNAVTNENEIALFINFVRQEPTAAYTASGTTLTLTSATASSDDMYCVYLGQAKQTVNAPDGSVGSSQVAASIITGQTALGATPADTDELLISDAGTLKRVDFSHLKGESNDKYAFVGLSSSQTISDTTLTKITFDSVQVQDGSDFNTTNNRYVVSKAGIYKVSMGISIYNTSNAIDRVQIYINKNGSTITDGVTDDGRSTADHFARSINITVLISCAVNDYIEGQVWHDSTGSSIIDGNKAQLVVNLVKEN
ncbi:hypothetical protein HTVC106P_gp52 [Pelagibacter phage HTVC106P]|nr:hypothetical protein HTVC106P_gp52 [Pelagibacter phage HTVC106P]